MLEKSIERHATASQPLRIPYWYPTLPVLYSWPMRDSEPLLRGMSEYARKLTIDDLARVRFRPGGLN